MGDEKKSRTADSPYKANFLWPFADGSIEEAAYEFANAATPEYQKQWFDTLKERIESAARNEGRVAGMMEAAEIACPHGGLWINEENYNGRWNARQGILTAAAKLKEGV